MKTLTIGKKISLACVALVALTLALGTVAALNIGRLTAGVQSLAADSLPGTYLMGQMTASLKEQKAAMLTHLLSETPEQMAEADATLDRFQNKLQAEWKAYEATMFVARDHELYGRLQTAHQHVLQTWSKIRALGLSPKTKAEANALWRTEMSPLLAERAKALDDLLEFNKANGDSITVSALAASTSAKFWSVLILLVSVVSGGLLAFFLVRGVNKVLQQAVTELTEGAEQVSSASGQVSASSQSLAQGASEQAASLEQTSASSEQMASMTRKNAENSQQAAAFMKAVSDRVAEANRTLADMMVSMEEIGSSSGKISKIIKVIDEIAFQTNILALNAAVEAARAGEAGMGFAVVAEEVRNLAQRSAQAAKDTATLIEDSILKSGEGSRKLAEVASSIQAVTEGAGKVKTLVDEVEASSQEQAQGIEQISKAVAQMDTVTQRTAASAEESASASEELSAQSQALMAVVEQLQSLVGANASQSSTFRKPLAPHRRQIQQAAASRPPVLERQPALTGAKARNAEFPLNDSDFREF